MGSLENNNSSRRNKSESHNSHTKSVGSNAVPAYQGEEPYIFVSYAHSDFNLVYPELVRFHNDGYKIWYDQGITTGRPWQEVVEDALIGSSLFVVFISKNAIKSDNVINEIRLAQDERIDIIKIYLDESEFKHGLNFSLKSSPSLLRYKMDEKEYVSTYRDEFENQGFEYDESATVIERIDSPPFPAYLGEEPYMFVSYAHADSSLVFSDLKRFHDEGYNIWYDQGITTGKEWHEVVEDALVNSELLVAFISTNSVESENVRKEIFLALDEGIDIIPIFLEDTKLAHGLRLQIRPLQSIYRHNMSDEHYIEKCMEEFEKNGLEANKNPPLNEQPDPMTSLSSDEDETEYLIKIIEYKSSDLNKKASDEFSQMKALYKDVLSTQNEGLLDYVNSKLKSIFDKVYVDEYLKCIKTAPEGSEFPSLLLNIQSESIKFEIIKATFLKLEKSDDCDDELIKQGYYHLKNNDVKGLERIVVQLCMEPQDAPSINEDSAELQDTIPQKNDSHKDNAINLGDGTSFEEFEKLNTTTKSIHKLGEHDVVIVLNDGTNLTSWDDVDDKEDILYVSEDLSDYSDLSDKYRDLKSLKAIVATNVSCNATNMEHMFSGCSSLVDISSLKDWNTNNVADMNGMFKGCSSLEDISALKDWNTASVTDMNGMFDGCSSLVDVSALKDWDTANVADISGMFYGCSSLTDAFSLKNWDTSNLKFMTRVFRGCSSLIDVSALKNWDIGNVADMNSMFKGCSSLVDIFALKNWNMANVGDLSGLFYDCSSLEDIFALKSWRTKNVADMNSMFKGCSSLVNLSALKDWNTSNVVDMSEMFDACSSLVDILALKNWNTKILKDVTGMFSNCPSLVDVSALKNWDTGNVIYMKGMFDGSTNIKTLPKWYKK